MLSKIVVGVDGSDHADHALRFACDLAQKYGSEIHLVHTPQAHTVAFALGAVAGYHTATTMPSAKEVQEAADKVMAQSQSIVKEYGLAEAPTHTELGDPAYQLITCAKETGADLIVTGRRGLSAVGAVVQGSTTQRVNHLAECACLSVM